MELYFPMVLDGATGSELQKRGYKGDIMTEQWVMEHPEALQDLQKGYLDAGTQIIYAPTFSANRIKLEENGFFNKVEEFNKKLVGIAREAVGDRAMLAGDISPTGKFLAPLGSHRFDELVDVYREQAAALEEAGVDVYVIETMMTVADARAAVLGVRSVSRKPILVTFTCDEKGRTIMGCDILAVMTIMQSMDIQAFGMNCSVGPSEMLAQLERLKPYAELPLIAKPNAGLPETVNGETVYNCPPEEFTQETEAMLKAGAGLLGGCCGTHAGHIGAIRSKMIGAEFTAPTPDFGGKIACATEKEFFLLDPDTEFGQPLACDEDLADRIEELEEKDPAVFLLEIRSEEELDNLEECQFMFSKPLVLLTEDAGILEEALKLYQGRALYAGGLSDEVLAPLARKYGLIF